MVFIITVLTEQNSQYQHCPKDENTKCKLKGENMKVSNCIVGEFVAVVCSK